jgi:hypothetical protein
VDRSEYFIFFKQFYGQDPLLCILKPVSCLADSNNNKHFGDANLTMPRMHSNCFTCCTVTISNNGVHSTNASMAPVDSCTRPSVSGWVQAGVLEREGVKGGRAAASSRTGGRLQPAGSVEDSWGKHEHGSLPRGYEVAEV